MPMSSKGLNRPGWYPIVTALGVLLAGCSVGPNFVRPAPATPAKWSAQAVAPTTATMAALTPPGPAPATTMDSWWLGFGDALLNSLIERSRKANLDLRAAVLRIEEARAQRNITAAAYWPSLDANASFSRQRLSETTPTGSLFSSVSSIKLPNGGTISVPNPYSQWQLAGGISWEIDFFGRIRRSLEAANAAVEATVEDQHAVQVSLEGDVSQAYLLLRGAQAHLAVAHENLATIEELLDLSQAQRAAGLNTELDVSAAKAEAALTRAGLPLYELQITEDINQLSQLLGREPEALRAELETAAPLPPAPPALPLGVPADLARRRPDIREAEANLHVATAQIGVGVADLFPRLTLSANGGYQAQTSSELLKWASRFGSIGPSLDVPVFDLGRWRTVKLYRVRAQEAALAYQHTVLNALHEVENALASLAADQARQLALQAAVAQQRDVLQLSRQRYEKGLTSFVDVLSAERNLQQDELSLIDSSTAAATDLVNLSRALGGGWQSAAGPAATPEPL